MSNYYATVSQAIDQRRLSSWPKDTRFEHLGKGSFLTWKVEVLLHEEGKGWKFEKATIFQRIAWKVAKHLPFFSGWHKKVNLAELFPKLQAEAKKKPTTDMTMLCQRIETLRQIKSEKPATDPLRLKLQELNLGWILPKNGPVDFISYTNPEANVTIKPKEDAKPQVEFYYIPPGKVYPENGHGEFFAVVQDLLKVKTKEEVEHAAIIQLSSAHSPDVICQKGDKIRIYDGGLANNDRVLLYNEYNTVDEAFESYRKDQKDQTYKVMTELFSLRNSLKNNFSFNTWTLRRFKNEYANDSTLAPFMKDFVERFNDGVKKIEGKEMKDLKADPQVIELRKLVSDALTAALLHFNANEQILA